MKNLPGEQVKALGEAYKKAKRKREAIRYRALWLLARGYTRKQVKDILGVGSFALGSWVTQYRRDGLTVLKDKPQPGNHRKLTNDQKQTIKELINHQNPQEAGYEGRFWDVTLLKQLVKDRFQVEYKAYDSYTRLFNWCGFTYHKPDKVNNRQSVKSKQEFEERLKKSWRGIAREMGWYW